MRRHMKGRKQGPVAEAMGVSQPTLSRWLNGKQGIDPANAMNFARAVDLHPAEALVALGLMTEAEAKVGPVPALDASQLSNDELLELVRARMREEGGEGHAGGPAPTQPPAPGPGNQPGGLRIVESETPPADDIVQRYLGLADGDAGEAQGLLGHDGAKGADVPEKVWTEALGLLERIRDEQRGAAEPGQRAARGSSQPPLADEERRRQDEDAERGDE